MNSDFKDLISLLNRSKVRYLVVGGYAVMFHDAPRFTRDLDVFVADDEENIRLLGQAMSEFGFPLPEEALLALSQPNRMISVGRAPSRIDILNHLTGLEFESVWPERSVGRFEDIEINFIGLKGLIAAKRATSRPQDLIDLARLEAIENGDPTD